MLIGAILLAYAAVVGVLGPRLTRQAGWLDKAPMLAIAGYLTAAWSVIATTALAGLALAVHATALGGGLSELIGACVLRLRATYSTPGGSAVAVLGLGLAGAVLVHTVGSGAARLRTARRETLRHARTTRPAMSSSGSPGCCARPSHSAERTGCCCAPGWPRSRCARSCWP
jgi:hypothetical protein